MYHVDSEECSTGARMPEIFGMGYKPKQCFPELTSRIINIEGALFYTVIMLIMGWVGDVYIFAYIMTSPAKAHQTATFPYHSNKTKSP